MSDSSKTIIADHLPATVTEFAPVPCKQRERGWSPARQKAFIQTLAETGSVTRAAKSVGLTAPGAYYLRRHPKGAEFRKAWEAALELAMGYLKDLAFERTIEGQLEPVWQSGKLVGYQRKFNDQLLMFMLRHYGDGGSKRVTVNYVKSSTNVAAGAGSDGGVSGSSASNSGAMAAAESSVMTVRSKGSSAKLTNEDTEKAASKLQDFSGVTLDEQAEAEIARVLEECAARREEFGGTTADVREPFVRITDSDPYWQGSFEPEGGWIYHVRDLETNGE